ncbi:alkaline phosphatase family protein [Geobacter sp. DSM 9736]|uniref:alkaline phosphatase family protein n=1 Tax=Geobacter sp. DSM 9736 TaxID=1277350 RepID=UPI000B5DEBDE|nr:nucleotide pyrophosphatase/phosphodiesterase family protein [Geobacter sp. DSM 9736]SNB44679.1 Predicted pyrophosphatase or phosphodiesterase, AlkP superfamily [Geobacter sp. DSM 9736]
MVEVAPVNRTVVINMVGLSSSLLGPDTPRINQLASSRARVRPLCPAVTCSMQATYLTGKLPGEHGIVGNGWYFRDLSEVFFWRQSNRLVQGEKVWHAGRKRDRSFTCANSFWWYNMATDADWSVTPRPIYCADGRKIPDCYTAPGHLREDFTRRFGRFPLFRFWGPATSIESSRWIADAAMALEEQFRPILHLIYLPHLDYCLQKVGSRAEAVSKDLREIDTLFGTLADFFLGRGCRLILLSEYGISQVDNPVHPNRILREAGLLGVKTDLGREYLDPGAGRAFAVADHQIAHVYVRGKRDVEAIKSLFLAVPGIEHVLDVDGKRGWGLDHERSGELILVACEGSWFTYYFWEEDARAPDYARTVNIHAKPGYDPCELFLDPRIRFPALKVGTFLMKQRLGFRGLMEVIPLDARVVRGSHGRVPEDRGEWPLLVSSENRLVQDHLLQATDVCKTILDHVFID